jgi:hypothetical protein
LEDILARPLARKLLRRITATNGGVDCFFERFCRSYNNPALGAGGRWKWRLPEFLIDLGLRKAGLDKQRMTEKVFHHQPTVRALASYGCLEPDPGLQSPLPALLPVRDATACAG